MKKTIITFLSLCLILTGCGVKDKKDEVINDTNNPKVNETTNPQEETDKNNEEENSEKTDNVSGETEKEDNVNNNNNTNNNSTTNNNTTNSNNNTSSNTQSNTNQETPSCVAKKFSKKYSYVYKTNDECLMQGNTALMEVIDNIDSKAFTYGCDKIVDDCGTTWYGVHFVRWKDDGEGTYIVYY